MRIEYHRTLIADKARNQALFQALKELIIKGETVVADIGTGTGLLALMALKLGAREVHVYETSPEMAQLAQAIFKKNHAKNYYLYPCRSTEMMDPPKVDLIVSETLGNYALEENIIETLNDARKRMLKSGGKIIPSKIVQYASPVISPRIADELAAWARVGYGFDLAPAYSKSLNNIYVRKFALKELLTKPKTGNVWDIVDLTVPQKQNRQGHTTWTLPRDHMIYGFAYWWEAELCKNVKMSTSPDLPPTHWEQLYFPLEKPLSAKKGDKVTLEVCSESSFEMGTNLRWSSLHKGSNNKVLTRQTLDLNKGWIP
ncbi:MAG: 50S ribosomal protein L11 methyltransferase [Hyphomicrobium sp.]